MSILGIGTDIVECPRIGRMIEHHGELFLRRAFTEREIRYCQARRHAIEHFAGRWAAKEAILKALGTTWVGSVSRTDLEIRAQPAGPPRVLVRGAVRDAALARGVADILVSIAHCRTYATAYAMAVGGPRDVKDKDAGGPAAPDEAKD
jgi:holo-[acyl-carrier protein] synthase